MNSLPYSENPEIYLCYEDFNEIYYILRNGLLDFRPAYLTPKGNLRAIFPNYYRTWTMKIVRTSNNMFKGIKLVVIIEDEIFKCSFGQKGSAKSKLTGYDSFRYFIKACKKYNVDLKEFAIEDKHDAEAVKHHIPSPDICKNYMFPRSQYEHVHHLDIHSAWPAGVISTYPEFKPVFEELYNIDKTVGPKALGYCQSDRCNYKYSYLAYLGISWCHNKIRDLLVKMQDQDFGILMVNTDGIWYVDVLEQGRMYHDEDEGTEIGQWKHDHIDCKWEAVSSGYYYYIENDVFKPVCRGKYAYEYIKPRSEWDIDDFFRAAVTSITMEWDDEIGFKIYKSEWNGGNICLEDNINEPV